MAEERKPSVSGPVERNIRTIANMERAHEQEATPVDRLAGAIGTFAGSKSSIALHLSWFTLWILINTRCIPGIRPFDPFPFPLLSVSVSCEAVLLSIFVLFKQNHMQRRADHLEQLNTQVVLLTEKEVTKALQLLRAVCLKLEIAEPASDRELAEMSEVTSVGMLADRILEDLPPKS